MYVSEFESNGCQLIETNRIVKGKKRNKWAVDSKTGIEELIAQSYEDTHTMTMKE